MKTNEIPYNQKFKQFLPQTRFSLLLPNLQEQLGKWAHHYLWSQQDLRQVVDMVLDLSQWQDKVFTSKWEEGEKLVPRHLTLPQQKKEFLALIINYWNQLKSDSPNYQNDQDENRDENRDVNINGHSSKKLKLSECDSGDKIYGDCPVASPETICCNLKTIDAVQNCAFGCHYCSIQTFYNPEGVIGLEADLPKKLSAIPIDPNRLYHFGTGQSSDALTWGNKNETLSHLCDWAKAHPNVFLEFKTKSAQVKELLSLKPPKNIICSWSLNTPTIVTHEEPLTASLEQRLKSARLVADQGVTVAFHFHPIIRYHGWETDYFDLTKKLLELFRPEEIAFISLGTLTFIKPVMKQIREAQYHTKILQMPLEEVAGRYSYPAKIKKELFKTLYNYLAPWHQHVFFYLCMEPKEFWESTFGFVYQSNDEFESQMCQAIQRKSR